MYPYPRLFPTCPIEALPGLLYNAVCDVAALGSGIPGEILLPDVIGACSAAVQANYDAKGIDNRTMPTSLNTLSLAPSGAGKSKSFSAFFRVFFGAETEQATVTGQGVAQPDPANGLILQEVSYRALMEHLSGTRRTTTIQHDDGWSFLHSDLISKYPDKLTQLWSGGTPLRHKVHGTDLVASGSRCSFGLRIQPELFYPFLRKTNNISYHQGLWPRAIAACYTPTHTGTFRTISLMPSSGGGMNSLATRLMALLIESEVSCRQGCSGREIVALGLEAQTFMRELQFRLKHWLERDYVDIKAAAARAWENTLRLAAVFHVICCGEGLISREMVERAWTIVEWSLSQHRLILDESDQSRAKNMQATPRTAARNKAPRPNQSAQSLKACIEEVCRHRNEPWVPINDIEALTDLPPLKLRKAWAWLRFKKEISIRGVGARATVSINVYSSQGSL